VYFFPYSMVIEAGRVTEAIYYKVTGAGLAHLAPLTRLQELDLSESGITDDGLAHLVPLVWVDVG